MLESLQAWFLSFGTEYGVDPVIFGVIYVGAIPFFMASIAWFVRNKKAKKSIVLPTLFAGFFFISAYLYLAVAGKNIPVWVWGILGAMIIYGVWSTVKSVKQKISD